MRHSIDLPPPTPNLMSGMRDNAIAVGRALTLHLKRWRTITTAALLLIPLLAPAQSQLDSPNRLRQAGDAPPVGSKKWHPGHWMHIRNGDPTDLAWRKRAYDEIANETAVEGVVIPLRWHMLEGAQGDYSAGLARLHEEIDYLKRLAVPKRAILIVVDHMNASWDANDIFPPYVISKKWNYTTGSGKPSWRRWEQTPMTAFINMIEAYGAEFDGEPYFDGIIVIAETALSFGGDIPSGYSGPAYRDQLERLGTAAAAAFPRSNVVMPDNNINQLSQADHEEFFRYLEATPLAVGGSDVIPNNPTAAQRIWMGVDGGVDYRGTLPIIQAVESSELGGVLGDFTPKEIYNYADDELHVNYLLWHRNTHAGDASQQWETGILPFIRDNPLTHTTCPSVYGGACQD